MEHALTVLLWVLAGIAATYGFFVAAWLAFALWLAFKLWRDADSILPR